MNSNQFEVTYFKHPIYQDYACDSDGNIYSFKNNNKPRLIKQQIDTKGYFQINVYRDGIQRKFRSHRFIYECCHNKILNKNIEIDHIDRNQKNNDINNLREVNRLTNVLNRHYNKEVNQFPDDVIKILEYNFHKFENLWFSPSTNCCYRISDGYIFEIPFDSIKRVNFRDINKIRTYICLNKLREILGC